MKEVPRLRVFLNRVLRGIFWPDKSKVTIDWRKLRKEELNDLYCSTNIFRVIKSRRKGWDRHAACMGRGEVHRGFRWRNLKEGDHLRDRGVVGKIILKWLYRKWDGEAWTGFIWLRIGTGGRQLCMR
jgi:hypothetical protein